MAEDLKRFAARITELRGELSKAQVARRVGISQAYMSSIEAQKKRVRPAVPIIRILADVIGGSRAELLLLAGYDEDAVYDQVKEMKAARAAGAPTEPDVYRQLEDIVAEVIERERHRQAGEAPGDGRGAQRSRPASPDTTGTDTPDTRRRRRA